MGSTKGCISSILIIFFYWPCQQFRWINIFRETVVERLFSLIEDSIKLRPWRRRACSVNLKFNAIHLRCLTNSRSNQDVQNSWAHISFLIISSSAFCVCYFDSPYSCQTLPRCIREGFHGWDLMVVVGFSGSLAVFWRLFFLTFHQSLWPASSEDSTLCSGVVCLGVEYLWLWDRLLSYSGDGWWVCLVMGVLLW